MTCLLSRCASQPAPLVGRAPRPRLAPHTHPFRGVIVPPLPEKNAVQKFTMGTDFIEERRRALQVKGGV